MTTAATYDTDWSIPETRPTVRVPAPDKTAQSHSLRVVLFELGRMSSEDLDRVRKALEVVR